MNEKTLNVLEYPKILQQLAALCTFSPAKARALALRPTPSLRRARQALQVTAEARRFDLQMDASLGGARDIRPLAEAASRGRTLTPEELLNIQATLAVARRLHKQIDSHAADYPLLAEIAAALPDERPLIRQIGTAIAADGTLTDAASPRLAGLRRRVQTAQQRLSDRLQRYLNDKKTASLLQEAFITQRDGRYVLPVKAQHKGQLPGIVHDQSASGATLFIEPLPVVALNNALREAQLALRDEEQRVLAALSQQVGERAAALIEAVETLAELDLLFAKARYAEALGAHAPDLHDSDGNHQFALRGAWHPLLNAETAVRNDIILPPGTRALVLTGPNTGGKTVTLKTVGLLALMAQSGLHIPADADSSLPCFRRIYADIGDEQSIEQSLSTFSGHIRNIVRILKKADAHSLVILDELGAGTDPQEGAALARAILAWLVEKGAYTFVATHYPELKTFAHASSGVLNASLEFNLHTLRPTYRLTIGLPGRSNALAIARRLGLPEDILQRAASQLDPGSLHADDLLDEIQRQRNLARKERRRAERKHAEVRKMRRQLRERLAHIEDERLAILEQARQEAEEEIRALRAEIRRLRRRLPLTGKQEPKEDLRPLEEEVRQLEKKVKKAASPPPAADPRPAAPLRVGARVHVRTLGIEGVIQRLDDEEAEVQAGALRMRLPLTALQPKAEKKNAAVSAVSSSQASVPAAASPGIQIDLRGQTVDEALTALDRHLEKAFLAGLPFVRVVHGKGTGALRAAIREWLPTHPHVASFAAGSPAEGGEGVTIVHLHR